MAVESRYRTICVEGPIAVGKTSLVNRLAERYNARIVLEEFDDNPFLREFYRDPESVAFQTQVYFARAFQAAGAPAPARTLSPCNRVRLSLR